MATNCIRKILKTWVLRGIWAGSIIYIFTPGERHNELCIELIKASQAFIKLLFPLAPFTACNYLQAKRRQTTYQKKEHIIIVFPINEMEFLCFSFFPNVSGHIPNEHWEWRGSGCWPFPLWDNDSSCANEAPGDVLKVINKQFTWT